jgi:hypothetical protein
LLYRSQDDIAGFRFNRRRRGADRKIETVLRKHAKQIYRLYVRLKTFEELPAAQSYEVKLYLLVSQTDYIDENKRGALDQAAARIGSLLDNCDGVDAIDTMVIPDISVRLSDLRQWTPWDTAEFSAGEEPTPRP